MSVATSSLVNVLANFSISPAPFIPILPALSASSIIFVRLVPVTLLNFTKESVSFFIAASLIPVVLVTFTCSFCNLDTSPTTCAPNLAIPFAKPITPIDAICAEKYDLN